MSALALENGIVYYTYSAYQSGVDALCGMYECGSTGYRDVATRRVREGTIESKVQAPLRRRDEHEKR